jgi:uncharacterized damage-inducible protein DinB
MTTGPDDRDSDVPERWSAATVRSDIWVDPDGDPRDSGAPLTAERDTLLEYLRAYRMTLEMKCADLDAAQLARRSVPPSTMSLLGLVRHMAEVERGWFRRTMAGEQAAKIYCTEADPNADWDGAVADPDVVAKAWVDWHEEVGFAERFVAGTPELGATGVMRDGRRLQLREVIVHMIEEYARHCGHADLIRERVDGRVGQ